MKNGSGVKGEAQNAVKLLEGVGFTQFDTSNASSYGYKKTEIVVKDGFPSKALDEIFNALNQEYDIASESSALQSSEYDVEVILGVRK